MTSPAHAQGHFAVRFDWGLTGALALTSTERVTAVVVDVLSFSTAVSVACDRGTAVYPFPWRDHRATSYAAGLGAVLAQGRKQADAGVSLSPRSIRDSAHTPRLVLPSPNGSTICRRLQEEGVPVVTACLRNAATVGQWLGARLADGSATAVTVIAAGERWPDGSLRPAVEDLLGAGAVLSAMTVPSAAASPASACSPESRAAVAAYQAALPRLTGTLRDSASGRELIEYGFADDVAIAAELDSSSVVPLLSQAGFFQPAP